MFDTLFKVRVQVTDELLEKLGTEYAQCRKYVEEMQKKCDGYRCKLCNEQFACIIEANLRKAYESALMVKSNQESSEEYEYLVYRSLIILARLGYNL